MVTPKIEVNGKRGRLEAQVITLRWVLGMAAVIIVAEGAWIFAARNHISRDEAKTLIQEEIDRSVRYPWDETRIRGIEKQLDGLDEKVDRLLSRAGLAPADFAPQVHRTRWDELYEEGPEVRRP